ncbi:hypothetical protein NDU88_005228 [Pleurodeles waltl]|uniref:Uncharacterized protein n=1 Tax=Pleurodeles waltl TaxID=8319 RepID=A0AAV7MZJ1_PLEWA|nr:hypothetical protein NDU88_005228 [Pleurodeles waltl]
MATTPAPPPQAQSVFSMHPAQPPLSAQGQPTGFNDATAQVLLSVAQLLSKLDIPLFPVPLTVPCAPPDTVKNAIADLKQQINDIVALHFTGEAGPGNKGSSDIQSPDVKEPPKLDSEPGKVTDRNASKTRGKPEVATFMIFYSNKILKAHHLHGGTAWLEYDRDFRWAKVEDPDTGWDQTEVNVFLECVNSKIPGKQPF